MRCDFAFPEPQSTPPSKSQPESNEGWDWPGLIVDFLAVGYSEDLFWSLTPRQIAAHFAGARKRLRREANSRVEQAYLTAALPNMKDPPALKDLLVDVDAKPRGKQDWRAIKAALTLALPPSE